MLISPILAELQSKEFWMLQPAKGPNSLRIGKTCIQNLLWLNDTDIHSILSTYNSNFNIRIAEVRGRSSRNNFAFLQGIVNYFHHWNFSVKGGPGSCQMFAGLNCMTWCVFFWWRSRSGERGDQRTFNDASALKWRVTRVFLDWLSKNYFKKTKRRQKKYQGCTIF